MATSQTDSYSAWAVGWAGFAAVMMIILGIANELQGIVALANEEFYVVGQEWIFEFTVTTWGWIHLLGGIIVAIAGFGTFTGSVAARTVGVIIAGLEHPVELRVAALLPDLVGDPHRRRSCGHLGPHRTRSRTRRTGVTHSPLTVVAMQGQ